MRKLLVATVPIILGLACAHPEVDAFRQRPTPVSVSLSIPGSVPDGSDVKREYAAALRARLATRVVVVPDGVTGPADMAQLEVEIVEAHRAGTGPSPVAVGVATGVTVGVLSAASGNRLGWFDGFWWGIWAASNAAHSRHQDINRLGYRPLAVSAMVRLVRLHQPGAALSRPLAEFSVEGAEVMDAMDPLTRREADEDGRVREEEARAFARVVVAKLQDRFGWTAHGSPDFYQAPETKSADHGPVESLPVSTQR